MAPSSYGPTLVLWRRILARLGVRPEASDAAFEDVWRRYSEPHRHYHTLEHIDAVVFHLFVLAEAGPGDSDPMGLAAVLHDVVYDPRASDNEERSAEYAREVLASLGVGPAAREEVARLILLTRGHETTADDPAGQCLLDADLAVLGADPAEYDRYAAAIRREYDWVPDAEYRAGRRAVLGRFLARPRIYHTPLALATLERPARANLAREVAALGGTG